MSGHPSSLPVGAQPPLGAIPPPAGVKAILTTPPMQLNVVAQSVCIAFTSLFVGLRICSRMLVQHRFYLEDYVAFGAHIGFLVYLAMLLLQTPVGIGQHLWNISRSNAAKLFEYGFIAQALYGPVVFLTKASILLLYIRLFHIMRRFVFGVKILLIFMALYHTASTLAKIFTCQPVSYAWNAILDWRHLRSDGHCKLDPGTIYLVDCVLSFVQDCLILTLPLPIIWKMSKLSWKQKLGTSVALGTGGLACIASIFRFYVTVHNLHDIDRSYKSFAIMTWASGEIALGITAGCLQALPALWRHIRRAQADHANPTLHPESYDTPVEEVIHMQPITKIIPLLDSKHGVSEFSRLDSADLEARKHST